MANPPPVLRVNAGGNLAPDEVVGRDIEIARMWQTLARQSVLLTAERRMGKTSVLHRMLAEPPTGFVVLNRNLQSVNTPDEFVRALVADAERAVPGLFKRSLAKRLADAGVSKVGVSAVSLELAKDGPGDWKTVAETTLATLAESTSDRVIFLWDELPHMLANIRDEIGPQSARQVLDLLRAGRETYGTLGMVFSGSIGLHHVVGGLREEGGMWAPVHDMIVVDLPPLRTGDAEYLAGELLTNEQIACDDVAVVSTKVAEELDSVPFYIHHLMLQLRDRQQAGSCGTVDRIRVSAIVEEMLADPLDPWQLGHYVDRVRSYYKSEADVVYALLDAVALAPSPLDVASLQAALAAHQAPPDTNELNRLLELLCKDHYLVSRPGFRFKLSLVRRAWIARRNLA
jgi:hypothetical protein